MLPACADGAKRRRISEGGDLDDKDVGTAEMSSTEHTSRAVEIAEGQ